MIFLCLKTKFLNFWLSQRFKIDITYVRLVLIEIPTSYWRISIKLFAVFDGTCRLFSDFFVVKVFSVHDFSVWYRDRLLEVGGIQWTCDKLYLVNRYLSNGFGNKNIVKYCFIILYRLINHATMTHYSVYVVVTVVLGTDPQQIRLRMREQGPLGYSYV